MTAIHATKHHVLVHMSQELFDDLDGIEAAIAATLRGDHRPIGPPMLGPPRPPDLWLNLLAADLGPTARAVLDLHHPEASMRHDGTVYWWWCDGCDWAGPGGEPADWPCRTVDAIAEMNW